ncbi:predicted protein [Botrytis cinerea T4]|uniref:Uncharacterized protein n=1 Tax=Botryotinia fuckeliana (strain T4) TaxID=999810 RepID=G2YYQ4_BOTF4|nr:predicted protein [Botrytis cinerea T4]
MATTPHRIRDYPPDDNQIQHSPTLHLLCSVGKLFHELASDELRQTPFSSSVAELLICGYQKDEVATSKFLVIFTDHPDMLPT